MAAQHIYGFDSEAHRFGLVPGEETLTDSVMLGLKRRRFPYVRFRGRLPTASHLRVHQFNITAEGKTGADWNLLFLMRDQRLNFRVQAKRLYPSGRYSTAKKAQMQRLLRVSAAQGAVPLYGFYNGPSSGAPVTAACTVPEQTRRGCTVVDANVVAAGGLAWHRAGIGSAAVPLECLASCFCFGGDLPGGGPAGPGPDGVPPVPSGPAMAKIDAGDLSAQRTLNVLARAAGLADPETPRPLTQAASSWPDALEAAVQTWVAGETGLLDELGQTLFAETSHVVLVVG